MTTPLDLRHLKTREEHGEALLFSSCFTPLLIVLIPPPLFGKLLRQRGNRFPIWRINLSCMVIRGQ